jgi:hypothetical protein
MRMQFARPVVSLGEPTLGFVELDVYVEPSAANKRMAQHSRHETTAAYPGAMIDP